MYEDESSVRWKMTIILVNGNTPQILLLLIRQIAIGRSRAMYSSGISHILVTEGSDFFRYKTYSHTTVTEFINNSFTIIQPNVNQVSMMRYKSGRFYPWFIRDSLHNEGLLK